jgi:WhiB family transcriptional regulator, redox-sensing transcriptional regulator
MSALPVPDHRPSPPAPSGWTQRAACRGEDPDLFYPPKGERGGHPALRELVAKRICSACPVHDECAAYALATDERYGVGGGLTASERERRRRRRA